MAARHRPIYASAGRAGGHGASPGSEAGTGTGNLRASSGSAAGFYGGWRGKYLPELRHALSLGQQVLYELRQDTAGKEARGAGTETAA